MAIQWEPEEVAVAERKRKALTVRGVVARYLEWYEAHRKAYEEVRNLFDVHVLPELGDVRVDQLTPDRLRRWHQGIAAKPARLRGGQTREAKTEDQKRARKVTANHALTALKAALNRAVEDGVIQGPGAWAIVKPFRGVDAARARYLEPEEVERLLNVCPPAFRELVTAALHTGARYGELASPHRGRLPARGEVGPHRQEQDRRSPPRLPVRRGDGVFRSSHRRPALR